MCIGSFSMLVSYLNNRKDLLEMFDIVIIFYRLALNYNIRCDFLSYKNTNWHKYSQCRSNGKSSFRLSSLKQFFLTEVIDKVYFFINNIYAFRGKHFDAFPIFVQKENLFIQSLVIKVRCGYEKGAYIHTNIPFLPGRISRDETG